jgi:hypothetical protein
VGDTTSVGIQRLLEAALREFGPDWEVASECSPINAGDPDHWPSGTRSFQVTLRHRATGARKILGRRTAGDAAARCHRGIAQLVISAYGERNTDPIRRYFGEIGIAAPTPGQIASEIKHVAGTNLLPGAAPSRPWATFIDQIRADQSRWLVIVQRHNPALYQSFRQTLADVERAQVVIDRRFGLRRLATRTSEIDRRQTPRDRRARHEIEAELETHGFALVRLEAGTTSSSYSIP